MLLPGPDSETLSRYHCGAAISARHTLALVNRGGATAADILDLGREIADAVWERFGVVLRPEPVLLGFDEPFWRGAPG